MKKQIPFLVLSTLTLFASCGKDGGGGSDGSRSGPDLEEQVAEGAYRAIMRPMNNQLSGFLPTGFAEIKIAGDAVEVKTLLDDDARVTHMQSIHMGTRCPNASDDSNKDGVIDLDEAYKASGNVFIPLDSDLNSAEEGKGIYPMGSGFTYLETASLARLESDARQRTSQNLNLGGRVVLIHGVDQKTQMPASVVAREALTAQAAVPVACGILKRQ